MIPCFHIHTVSLIGSIMILIKLSTNNLTSLIWFKQNSDQSITQIYLTIRREGFLTHYYNPAINKHNMSLGVPDGNPRCVTLSLQVSFDITRNLIFFPLIKSNLSKGSRLPAGYQIALAIGCP